MTLRRITRFAATGVLALSASAPQARAATSSITTCGQTVITNAVLTQNLFCAGQSAVIIGASGITIDLKGFVLRGNGAAYGIDDSGGWDNVSVKNGVIRNFFDGIRALDANSITVSNVVASGNNRGVVISGNFARIVSVLVTGTGPEGILVIGDDASVQSSTVVGGNLDGVVIDGARASVNSTTASGNGGNGVHITGDGASVKSAVVLGNTGYGILVEGNSASITSARASGNSTGIVLVGDSHSTRSSTAVGNNVNGIAIAGNAAVVKGNKAHGNGFPPPGSSDLSGLGIHVLGFTTAPTGTNDAQGNDDPAECNPVSLCPADG